MNIKYYLDKFLNKKNFYKNPLEYYCSKSVISDSSTNICMWGVNLDCNHSLSTRGS
jgi:hypothetical protein